MSLKFFRSRSIKTRVTLSILAIFVCSIWAISLYLSRALQSDIQRVLGEQQFGTVSMIAGEINSDVQDRLDALETIAATLAPAIPVGASATQKALETLPIFQSLFNFGSFVAGSDGMVIASFPDAAGRVGVSLLERDYIVAALNGAKSSVSQPVMLKAMNDPVFSMVAPIHDRQGKVIGALVGLTNLGKPNFLDKVVNASFNKTGTVSVIAPLHRITVTSSDKNLSMLALPPPGVNPYLDRNINGFEGYTILVNVLGQEQLASIKKIPAAQWYLYSGLSTAEVFAPAREMQHRILLAAILLTLLAGSLTWWILKRQLAPMFDTARKLAHMAESGETPQPLPITRKDEIGELIGGFNRLLETLSQRERSLIETDRLLKESQSIAGLGDYVLDINTGLWTSSTVLDALFGIDASYVRSVQGWQDLIDPEDRPMMADYFRNQVVGQRQGFDQVYRIIRCNDQTQRWVHGLGKVEFDGAGKPLTMHGTILDISKLKQAETALRESEARLKSIFNQAPLGIALIDSLNGHIDEVNPMFAKIAGRTMEEMTDIDWMGITHPDDVQGDVDNMALLKAGEIPGFQMEKRYLHRDGAAVWINITIAPVYVKNNVHKHHLCMIEDITARKAAQDQIQNLAFADPLTGLPNRRLLMDRLEQALVSALRRKHQDALMFIDMDDFKSLNDSLGHDKGDQLLKQIAGRVLACVREGDTVARLGGDEFVVLLEHLNESPHEAATQAEVVARKIHHALRQPFQLDSHSYHSSASIGITLFGGTQREPVEEPLRRAELAMYKAKAIGRNNLRFFEPEMRDAVNARVTLEEDLHSALTQSQFLLYYQAQVDRNANLTGVEAMVRWQHPERGLVLPAEFIPVAEASGLILPLGHWVLETACQQIATWAVRPEMSHLKIAVNVSARQFRLPNFVEEVLTVLEVTGANPNRLILELTESLLLDNMKDIIAKMTALKASGVGFSLDDFGTGYSSLAYLKRLPLDELKIDQGFVRDILTDSNDAAIAKMVISLAESMGLAVIAEGVETQAQRDALDSLGCHAFQGYLFSRPMPIREFEAFVGRD